MKLKRSFDAPGIRELMYADLKRHWKKNSMYSFSNAYFTNPGYKYIFYMRLSKYFKEKPLCFFLYVFCRMRLRHYKFKYGIEIPYCCNIGKGFNIAHFGGIVISGDTIIGKNCTIFQGVTIGRSGENHESPIIGDNVRIYVGAKVFGKVKVGHGAKIGANAVIEKDIPNNAIAKTHLTKIYVKNK